MKMYYEYLCDYGDIVFERYFGFVVKNLTDAKLTVGDTILLVNDAKMREGTVKYQSGVLVYCLANEMLKYNGFVIRLTNDVNVTFGRNESTSATGNILRIQSVILSQKDEVNVIIDDTVMKLEIEELSYEVDKVTIRCYDALYKLSQIFVRNVFKNTTVKNIISTILDFCGVDYEILIDEDISVDFYVVNDYALNELKKLVQGLYGVIVYEGDKVVIRKFGFEDSGLVVDDYSDISNVTVRYDDIINDIWLFGGDMNYDMSEEFTYSGSNQFELQYFPISITGVYVNGKKVYGYTIDGNVITITVDLSDGDTIRVDYTYQVPLVVHLQDDESIMKYGLRSKKVVISNLYDKDVARMLAKMYLVMFSKPVISLNVKLGIDKFGIVGVGKSVLVVLNRYGIEDKLTILNMNVRSNVIELTLGKNIMDITTWYEMIVAKISGYDKYYETVINREERMVYGFENVDMKVYDVMNYLVGNENVEGIGSVVNDVLRIEYPWKLSFLNFYFDDFGMLSRGRYDMSGLKESVGFGIDESGFGMSWRYSQNEDIVVTGKDVLLMKCRYDIEEDVRFSFSDELWDVLINGLKMYDFGVGDWKDSNRYDLFKSEDSGIDLNDLVEISVRNEGNENVYVFDEDKLVVMPRYDIVEGMVVGIGDDCYVTKSGWYMVFGLGW